MTTTTKLRFVREQDSEKVYIAETDQGNYIIYPVWSSVYEGKVTGYAVGFGRVGDAALQLGSVDLGHRYLDGSTDRTMGEKYFREAKAVAQAHYAGLR